MMNAMNAPVELRCIRPTATLVHLLGVSGDAVGSYYLGRVQTPHPM